jgi:hypothetical protein
MPGPRSHSAFPTCTADPSRSRTLPAGEGPRARWGRQTGRGRIHFALLLLAGLVACGSGAEGNPEDSVQIEPSVEEVFRVGTVDGSGWEAFAQIRSLAFDANGRLYILDTGQHHVVVLEPDGTFVRTIGSRGEGPEELRNPNGMTVLGTGEVAIYDMGHQAFLVFSPQGEFRRSIRAGIEEGMPDTRFFPHGSTGVVSVSRTRMIMRSGGEAPAPPTTAPIRHFDLSGDGETRVLHEAWLPVRDSRPTAVTVGGGGGMQIQGSGIRAFEPTVHLAALPDGRLVVSDTSSYRMDLLGPEGEELDRLGRDIRPQPVGDREREAERERRMAGLESGGGIQIQVAGGGGGGGGGIDTDAVREMLRGQLESMDFWHEIPIIERLATDAQGRIWVGRNGGVGERGPTDLFSPEGEWLGTLPTDFGPIPGAFGPDGLAAWVETDDLDVPYVRVRRLGGLP